MPSKREREICNILVFREDLGQTWAVPEGNGVCALVVPSMLEGNPLSRQSGVSDQTLLSLSTSGLVTLEWLDAQVPAYDDAKNDRALGAYKVGLTDEGRKYGQAYGKKGRRRSVSPVSSTGEVGRG
ncbi:hypothetical protein [Nonomuraea wenchangensis]|uniref:hypothetical protein n=1 Tax=Nonomuraea wenchangensis TaxID=568860 RepID=UPI00331D6250